ncbi:E3 ubiquitin-protein ligase RNF135 isoform X1 [Canis lupus baileyi]|uniref:E3 ubiquitin-protein ligase RNF135 n=2 Tax=Canis lupus familiaris TaxID=9615 RepID=A0A8C0P6X6_CANLF|nr:E3 ubiquitin-protein ligase RNF135 isoform X1 [Canis lupus familiaris]XP_025332273.1 E3 ubiquitin-protein ligase RNF135 isoform X1 [Canis lupus dingo]XP_038404093.1 E3 ubiquitin-protein ligase RNF135 isoform X1 [Canis lupus familiaris]XP_038533310.1 E3 ubiquitin-protein ligase RNF135 isoform X1 [Canis lupus familiaris]|eukprot:XP_005624884.1 E3 ubiquitin-protein ligase RNF135 isoform X1 [Canis lupus familiaris]
MAGPDPGPAVPVWLAEDDLGCIICHGLLAWPATLPCGHSFCRDCLKGLWAAGCAGPPRSCPTCRASAAEPRQLRKNTMLQELVDKYSRALREAAAQKSIKEVGRELTELVEQLVGIVRNLQSQKHLPESGPENERSTLSMGMSSSDGADLALASSKPVTSDTPERKMKDILHDLEEIQKKLQENFTWKGALEEHLQVELQEAPSSSSHPLPDHSCPAPRRAFQFAQWAISPTFDLRSHSCSLEVSEDCRVVTVSHWPQTHLWNHERFVTCQVLCSQAFSSGQQYWEVDTQHCSHWAVGVASWGMRRTQILGRTKDSYCVEWKGNSQLSAWHMVQETVLGSDRPKVVGIWLDLEEGKLAFYSVADQETLLYECPVSASSPLHPAFWLYGLNPGNSLTIRPVNV